MAAPSDSLLAAVDLRFGYGRGPDVIDLPALVLAPGERVFLHGPSGCGKSTLLNLLAGTLSPRAGRITVAGLEASALRRGQRDRLRGERLGFIFQQFNLLPFLSVTENVILPCRFSRQRRDAALREHGTLEAAAQTLLAALGLRDPAIARARAGALSVGQQQRVAAARALIGDPALVLADEPTSALDADAQRDFVDLLFAQCARTGAGLLFVSHDARLATRFDRVQDLRELNRAQRTAEAV